MLTRLSVLYPLVSIALALNVPRSFENTNVVRTIELGGSLSLSSTVYQVRALKDGVDEYTVTLSKAEGDKTSWVVSKLKDVELTAKGGFDARDNVYYYTIKLPTKLKRDETTSIMFGSTLSHASPPLPEFASQGDPVRLNFEGDMLLVSPYETLSQKTKLRAPTPQIVAYEDPEPASTFVKESQVTKSGSTVTYGPFGTVPSSASEAFQRQHQRRIAVQYESDVPVTSIVSQHRSAEISHWGANLNIQDDVHLVNGGPKLKGHFSRIEFQHARFYGRPPASTIASLTLALPAGIRNPYFYDLNGNVSTSRFRPSPSIPRSESPFLNRDLLKNKKSLQGKYSSLELTPRYPLMGGWNYTFTLGWDAPLADWGGVADSGKYVVAVPFLNTFKDTAVDTAELKIVLPEGATDVSYETPFAMDTVEQSTLVTYLDTVGRPVITMRKAQVTDKHDGIVYVSYRVPFSAHLKKPLAVATAMMGLFAFGFVVRRVDMRIHTTKGGKKKL